MKAEVSKFTVERPRSLDEALALMAGSPGRLTPLAGGTDLFVYLNAGAQKAGRWIDLWSLQELRGISETEEHFVFGALTTYTELRGNAAVAARLPMLAEAAATVGAVAIQNRGTLGGNIGNASPAGDSLPPLLAYDAEVGLLSSSGKRWVELRSFYTGYRASVMRTDELIDQVRVPKVALESIAASRFIKIGTRAAQAISKVAGAFALGRDSSGKVTRCRVAFGSMAATPVRIGPVEDQLLTRSLDATSIRESVELLGRSIHPIDDIRSTAVYRRHVACQVWERFLEEVK